MNTKEVRVTFRGIDKTRQAFGRIRKNFKDMERLSASVTRGFGGIGIAIAKDCILGSFYHHGNNLF